jgi:GrpB-like predicted nucleotidyltransferase (UPF0157 family)
MASADEPDFVTPRVVHEGPITLADPDPTWPEQYRAQELLIRAALGARAITVEHVGSTSVAGLPAKPILDISLEVADSVDEDAYVPALEAAGFVLVLREPGWYQHRLLRGAAPSVNLHVLSRGSPEVERMLTFRDLLRRDPVALAVYAGTKRELAARRWTYVQDYADAKSAVVETLIAQARGEIRG